MIYVDRISPEAAQPEAAGYFPIHVMCSGALRCGTLELKSAIVRLRTCLSLGKGRLSNDVTEPSYAPEIDTDMGVTGREVGAYLGPAPAHDDVCDSSISCPKHVTCRLMRPYQGPSPAFHL
jgi:hypothetical protein